MKLFSVILSWVNYILSGKTNEKDAKENEDGRTEVARPKESGQGTKETHAQNEEENEQEGLQVKEALMITREEILMGRDKQFPLTSELEANLARLLTAVNAVRKAYGKPMVVSSGYRPAHFNTAAGGAKRSAHMICMAVDFRDPNGEIDKWCDENQDLLESLGLWQEHPDATKGWCHLDIAVRAVRERPGCKKRQFKP